MTKPEILNDPNCSKIHGHEFVQADHPEDIRQLLLHLDETIRHADQILGVTAADLPELTEEDHDRLALERINHRRTR